MVLMKEALETKYRLVDVSMNRPYMLKSRSSTRFCAWNETIHSSYMCPLGNIIRKRSINVHCNTPNYTLLYTQMKPVG